MVTNILLLIKKENNAHNFCPTVGPTPQMSLKILSACVVSSLKMVKWSSTREQNKISQNKTKQNKTKQNKTKQNKTKQNKAKTKQKHLLFYCLCCSQTAYETAQLNVITSKIKVTYPFLKFLLFLVKSADQFRQFSNDLSHLVFHWMDLWSDDWSPLMSGFRHSVLGE